MLDQSGRAPEGFFSYPALLLPLTLSEHLLSSSLGPRARFDDRPMSIVGSALSPLNLAETKKRNLVITSSVSLEIYA